jgi:hypothetical protein
VVGPARLGLGEPLAEVATHRLQWEQKDNMDGTANFLGRLNNSVDDVFAYDTMRGFPGLAGFDNIGVLTEALGGALSIAGGGSRPPRSTSST